MKEEVVRKINEVGIYIGFIRFSITRTILQNCFHNETPLIVIENCFLALSNINKNFHYNFLGMTLKTFVGMLRGLICEIFST